MKSIFNTNDVNDFIARVEKLQPTTKALWGKMRVEQMLAHCVAALALPLGETNGERAKFIQRIIGKLLKPMVTGPKPFGKNSPTNPEFIITDERDFNKEKELLISKIKRVSQAGEANLVGRIHPFFGPLNKEEWNIMVTKHLDHHLQQFGV